MKIFSQELKAVFTTATVSAFPELIHSEVLNMVVVENPKNLEHGDYACAVALKLSKKLGVSTVSIAKKIIEAFPKDYRIASLEFAEPGYINLRLSEEFLVEALKQLETGFSVEMGHHYERPVIVEFSSTNAAKHMGVHHVLSTIIGDVLSNLFGFFGNEVIRINHLGDWGMNFAKLIYAIENWGDQKEIHRHSNDEFTRLYVKFHEEEEKNPELTEAAKNIFKTLENGDKDRLDLWKWIVQESLADLKKIFVRLGVEFDHITGESFYLKMAEDVLEEGIKKGLFTEGEGGALIFDLGGEKTPALIQKGDGTTLYLTRDVATVKYRVETWHPAAILYVVDIAQSLHFKQDFAISRALGYAEGTELEHIVFGRMNFADGAMSTRKGNVIRLDVLLDEAVKRAALLSAERGTELPREEYSALAEIVGVASVKYAVLSQDRQKDIVFDWNKIITLEGNSAPYLLYSYARCHSIVEKVGDLALSGLPELTKDSERALVCQLLKFPDALDRALQERKPHVVCTALYELCQEFNRFYGTTSVVGAETDLQKRSRLGLVYAFMFALQSGLRILGIPVLKRM
ncbi:arginine--tRNA ligase [Candidatus Peregrinibacteria bacterium RIFCSPLOWO2_02_FULL_48_14]|nr:MAG: arginine--tRNA ligase [Candidatus Peregrinibacteria bacterium RIFCSPLOWO2_02_FULL_48_14]